MIRLNSQKINERRKTLTFFFTGETNSVYTEQLVWARSTGHLVTDLQDGG